MSEHRRAARLRLYAAGVTAVAAVLGALASCSLGLDESRIGATGPGVSPDGAGGTTPDASRPDGASGDGTSCETDSECSLPSECFRGTCDTTLKRCVYASCLSETCTYGLCGRGTGQCGQGSKQPFGTRVGSLEGVLSCPVLGQCAASVHPFLFVLTASGAAVLSTAELRAGAVNPVAVRGLGFAPTRVFASGGRVFFLGEKLVPAVPGVNPGAPVSLAVVDVPSDPYAAVAIDGATVVASPTTPERTELTAILTSGRGELALGLRPGSYATSFLGAGLPDDPSSLPIAPLPAIDGGPAGALVGASADQALEARSLAPFEVSYAWVRGLGSEQLVRGAERVAKELSPVGRALIAPSATGAVALAAERVVVVDGGAAGVDTISLYFPWAQAGADPIFEPIEIRKGQGALSGLAWMDDDRVLVVTTGGGVFARIASRSGKAIVPGKALDLPGAGTLFATAGSGGVGYLVVAEELRPDAGAVTPALRIVDPRCD